MGKIFLFVSIEVSPEDFDEFTNALQSHIEVVKSEPGCESIEIYREDSEKHSLHLWEVWRDRQSWDAHMANANSAAWRANMSSIVRSETIKVLSQL